MKYIKIAATLFFIASFNTAIAQDIKVKEVPHSYVPKQGFVPDELTAVRVAEAIATPIYGKKQLDRQAPLTATLSGDIWTVQGTIAPEMLGGVVLVQIAKSDGRVIRVTHDK